jgi:GDP-mannose 6-dehydrogenase
VRIAIFGLGYVGFTVACCMSSQGHSVLGIDVDERKVADILAGISPILEPGVDVMLAKALRCGLIDATCEADARIGACDMAIVCVGTPSSADGSHDMRYIVQVTEQIAQAVGLTARDRPLTVLYRSTIRPGTMENMVHPIFEAVLGAATDAHVELVYNPEFLREATAVADYFAPPKIVVGTCNGGGSDAVRELYDGIDAPWFDVKFREAEAIKFVDNTWHAVKVAFGNEIGRICLGMEIDAAAVHEIFVSDTKLNISPHYLRPGGAFGGSCLPKDVRALQRISADCGANTHLIDSLMNSNEAHKQCLFEKATDGLQRGESILLVGLAFKAETDDLRESPNVDMARKLVEADYNVSIYDPAVNDNHLANANLGSGSAQKPFLLSQEEAETGSFSRTLICNATARTLDLSKHRVLDVSRI